MAAALERRLDDADPDVQLEAAWGVAASNPQLPRFAAVVRQLLAHDEIPPITQAALAELCGCLSHLSEFAAESLKRWLTTGTAEVREAAATALAQWGATASVAEAELAAALDDEEPIVREQAARALGHLTAIAPDTRAALRVTMADADAAVANAAQLALQRHQHETSPNRL
jgi:HEAT repeat protein